MSTPEIPSPPPLPASHPTCLSTNSEQEVPDIESKGSTPRANNRSDLSEEKRVSPFRLEEERGGAGRTDNLVNDGRASSKKKSSSSRRSKGRNGSSDARGVLGNGADSSKKDPTSSTTATTLSSSRGTNGSGKYHRRTPSNNSPPGDMASSPPSAPQSQDSPRSATWTPRGSSDAASAPGAPSSAPGGNGSSRGSRRSRRSQRRSRSGGVEDMRRLNERISEEGTHVGQGDVSAGGARYVQRQLQPGVVGRGSPRRAAYGHHGRARSMPTGLAPLSPDAATTPTPTTPGQQQPMVSAAGNPLIPILTETLQPGVGGGAAMPPPLPGDGAGEATPLTGTVSYRSSSGGHRKRKQHSRSRSDPAAIGAMRAQYGSMRGQSEPALFHGGGMGTSVPAPPLGQGAPHATPHAALAGQIPPSPGDGGGISRLGELKKSFSPTRRGKHGRSHSADLSNYRVAYGGAEPGSPQQFIAAVGAPGAMGSPTTPPSTPRASSLRNLRPSDMHVSFSPGTPLLSPGVVSERFNRGVYSVPETGDFLNASVDETAEFLPKDFGNGHGSGGGGDGSGRKHRRSNSSLRKMHMRQQSAQLFMADIKGTEQPYQCRDLFFAVLFVAHLAVMVFLGVVYGPEAFVNRRLDAAPEHGGVNAENVELSYHNVIIVAILCGAFAVALSAAALFVMTIIARRLVQLALVFSIALSFAWGTVGIGLRPKSFVPITGIIALALSVGYTFVVWDRIPFAASNLMTALSGVRAKWGTVLVSLLYQAIALGWTIFYTFTVIGVYDAIQDGDLQLPKHMPGLVYTLLGISYYWTFQVLLHVVQVTTAGAIGSWWFKPEEQYSCCDEAVLNSFVRSTFYSFGSICFGSLLVGPVQLLRQIAEPFRPNQRDSPLMCLQECLLLFQNCLIGCVDSVADNFNSWAFTYVGLYGYKFLEAGHDASALFQKRGWTQIVTDDLIPNVLFMFSLVIGGVTGCFGLFIEADWLRFTQVDEPGETAFGIGIVVGLVLSSVLLSVISSAVNASIVCFAGSPVEFEKNHPVLSHEMRSAWREVWPGCMDVVDMTVALRV